MAPRDAEDTVIERGMAEQYLKEGPRYQQVWYVMRQGMWRTEADARRRRASRQKSGPSCR